MRQGSDPSIARNCCIKPPRHNGWTIGPEDGPRTAYRAIPAVSGRLMSETLQALPYRSVRTLR